MDTMNSQKIVLAGGCFWGTTKFFKNLRGVLEVHAGYANSKVKNPTYKEVCTGETDAAEAAEVTYNATTVDLKKMLELYFKIIDPLAVNRQGNDVGTQYRTGIYYTTDSQRNTAYNVITEVEKQLGKKVAVELRPLKNFYRAEEEHQDYLDKNPGGYCHITPEMMKMSRNASILKKAVTTAAKEADTNYLHSIEENPK